MTPDREYARQQMIEQQIRTWDVLDTAVLAAFASVRREDFVPPQYRGVAFADGNVPLGHGQYMLAPKIDGKILQALAVQPSDEVLDVGTGSGFLAACLAKLGERVRSVEIVADLAERATANLHAAAINNCVVSEADAFQLADEERYDAVAVTGSLPEFGAPRDNPFCRALRIGGRLFVIIGEAPVMEACKFTRTGRDGWLRETLFETVVPSLANASRRSRFVF
jgi:protein-L-isoaspartate(D-aspartate) O-methyltransferase